MIGQPLNETYLIYFMRGCNIWWDGVLEASMGDKLTAKQLKFTREYAKDGNGTRAAISAGYAPNSAVSAASRMLTIDKVQGSVAKFHEKHRLKTEVTIESLAAELEHDRDRARQLDQTATAVTATVQIAKLYGLDINRAVNINENNGLTKIEIIRYGNGEDT
jgi:phage terminase small subunit